jgi:hypothetical protein
MRAIVFTGPTLSPAAAAGVLAGTCWPPAAQGDVYRAALQRPQAIGIIDGCFETEPAVWHNEILWALSQGIHVFGAAGIGALRAVELAPFGMEGIGEVFAAFRDGVLDDDSEVAVLQAGPRGGYAALSEALVNIRATVAQAQADGVLANAEAAAIVGCARAIFYKERTWAKLLAAASASLAPSRLARFEAWLADGRVDRKQLDALAMLRTMRDRLSAGIGPKLVTWRFQPTRAWATACRLTESSADPQPHGAAPS